MKTKLVKHSIAIMMAIAIFFQIIEINNKIYAANGLTISSSKTSTTVGESFTITVGSGIAGAISIKSSNSSIVSIESLNYIDYGSKSVTATAHKAGTAKITVTAIDLATIDADPKEVQGSKSITITVKEKEVTPTPAPTPVPTPTPTTSQSGSSSTATTTSKNNSNSSNSSKGTTKETNTKKEENVTVNEEEANPQFGMNDIIIKGIKEDNSEEEIPYTPTFNIDRYEYSCSVSKEIKKIKITTNAGIYNEYVKIENPEELKDGDNEILIKMEKDQTELTYKIKVTKESDKETAKEDEEIINKEVKQEATVTMKIGQFVFLLIAIMLGEAIILKIPWKRIIRKIKKR